MSPDRAEARAKAKAVVLEFYRSSVAPFHYTDEKWLIEHIAAALRAVAQDCAKVAQKKQQAGAAFGGGRTVAYNLACRTIAQEIITRWGVEG